jgi:DNA-binding winged helix-turn-helix (wHTH) protein/TolB-like protein/tetratricopeptide (TPR) repeat protein
MLEQKQQIYGFDNFRLDVSNRQLLHDGRPVALPAKAFDMLVVLIENGGRLIGKDEFFSRVWPDQIVEESNLTVQVSAIRKALGEQRDNRRYIVTVPGHGYRFTGNVLSLHHEEEEVVIERHSYSGLVIESRQEHAGMVENRFSKNFAAQNVGSLTVRDEAEALKVRRAVGWRTLLFAGLLMIVISPGVFLLLKRSGSADKSASTAPLKSIAILPFKPLVAASRDESLELGMAETLIMRLSSLREIKVPPTSAVRKYSGLEQDAVAAGRELQVESVLDGNIQKEGDRLRVTVRLVRVDDGQTIWTERFDENFTEIFAVQDRVSERLAAALAVRLTGEQREVLVKRYTNNTQAYELFLKGIYSPGGTEEGTKKKIEYYQQAINLDPGYALAYAVLAKSYMQLGSFFGFASPQETFPKAEAAARKALELDDTISDAHVMLGLYKMNYEWNWSEAERELKRAIELDPNNDGAHSEYGSYLIKMGRIDEAIVMRKRALDLVPPSTFPVIANLGNAYYFARQYDEAIKYHQRALELNPHFSRSHLAIGQAYVQLGKYEQAIAEINQAITLSGGDVKAIATLGHAYAVAGRHAEARKVLDQLEQLSKRKYVSPYFIAVIYAGLGERDLMFAWLEKAYQERHPFMTLIGVEPMFDQVRSDPRFIELVRRVGLPS